MALPLNFWVCSSNICMPFLIPLTSLGPCFLEDPNGLLLFFPICRSATWVGALFGEHCYASQLFTSSFIKCFLEDTRALTFSTVCVGFSSVTVNVGIVTSPEISPDCFFDLEVGPKSIFDGCILMLLVCQMFLSVAFGCDKIRSSSDISLGDCAVIVWDSGRCNTRTFGMGGPTSNSTWAKFASLLGFSGMSSSILMTSSSNMPNTE